MANCVFVKTEENVVNIKKEFENVDVKEEDPLMIPSNSETGIELDNSIYFQDTNVKTLREYDVLRCVNTLLFSLVILSHSSTQSSEG